MVDAMLVCAGLVLGFLLGQWSEARRWMNGASLVRGGSRWIALSWDASIEDKAHVACLVGVPVAWGRLGEKAKGGANG